MGWKNLFFNGGMKPSVPQSDVFVLKGFSVPANPAEFGYAIADWSVAGAKGLFESFVNASNPHGEGDLFHGISASRRAAVGDFAAVSIAVFVLVTQLLNRSVPKDIPAKIAGGMLTFLPKTDPALIDGAPDEAWCRRVAERGYDFANRMNKGLELAAYDPAVRDIAGDVILAIWQSGGRGKIQSETAETDYDAAILMIEIFASEMLRHVKTSLAPRYVR